MSIRTLLAALAAMGLCGAVASAQVDERPFLLEAAKKLDAFATRCSKNYPTRAAQTWWEVLREYDEDDAVARENLGFTRAGTSWAVDPKFEAKTENDPDPRVSMALAKTWRALAKDLAAGHRDLAVKLQEAGAEERAQYHFGRALRFSPDDSKAIASSGRKSFEGLFGTEVELTMLKRSRQIDRLVTRLLEKDYPVEPLPDGTKHDLLDRGGVPYEGVESEHFVVWGNWPRESLMSCAKYAERSLEFFTEMLSDYPEFRWPSAGWKHHLGFFKSREEWATVLRANSGAVNGNLDFILENASGARLGSDRTAVRLCGFENLATIQDMSVREVAQVFSGLGCDALTEGIGHAACGWFFGRNLVFSVAPPRPEDERRTSSGAKRREVQFRMPDIEVWKELAIELAWERTDTPSAKLPLIRANDFSNVDRIKAWGICDYLMRRDPLMLRQLDACRNGLKRETLNDVAEAFMQKTGGYGLHQLDDDWRSFWTTDSAILAAIKGGTDTPLEVASRRGPEFLEAFNGVRRSIKLHEVEWSAEYTAACRQHAEYLKANRSERGLAEEHAQDPSKIGGSNAGRLFAEKALVDTSAKDAKKTIESWLDLPGYRDALVNPGLEQIGLFVDGPIVVIDAARGQAAAANTLVHYPHGVKPGSALPNNPPPPPSMMVPTEVKLKDLGPEVEAALRRAGKRPQKVLGYPVSLHFFRTGALPRPESLQCVLKREDKDVVDGFVHIADGGRIRTSSAPGLVVFYPLAPLARGSTYTVEWSFERQGGKQNKIDKYQFWTR